MNKRGNKKGVSPVIATVLLIAMVVVIALIIFLWFRGLTSEAVVKFDKNIELVCADVSFEGSYSGGTLYISNTADIPIFGMKVKASGGGSYETTELTFADHGWPTTGLNQGGTFSGEFDLNGASELLLIPVLVGSSDSGDKKHTCDERYGYEIVV